jgi:hypothetical protein
MCGAQLTVRDAKDFGFGGCLLLRWLWPWNWGRIRFGAGRCVINFGAKSKQKASQVFRLDPPTVKQSVRNVVVASKKKKKKRLNGIAV